MHAPDLLLYCEEGGDGCGKDREHSPGVAVGLVLISVCLAAFGEGCRWLRRWRRRIALVAAERNRGACRFKLSLWKFLSAVLRRVISGRWRARRQKPSLRRAFRSRRADFGPQGLSGRQSCLLASVLQPLAHGTSAGLPGALEAASGTGWAHKTGVPRSSTPVHSQSIAYTNNAAVNAYYGRRR